MFIVNPYTIWERSLSVGIGTRVAICVAVAHQGPWPATHSSRLDAAVFNAHAHRADSSRDCIYDARALGERDRKLEKLASYPGLLPPSRAHALHTCYVGGRRPAWSISSRDACHDPT